MDRRLVSISGARSTPRLPDSIVKGRSLTTGDGAPLRPLQGISAQWHACDKWIVSGRAVVSSPCSPILQLCLSLSVHFPLVAVDFSHLCTLRSDSRSANARPSANGGSEISPRVASILGAAASSF